MLYVPCMEYIHRLPNTSNRFLTKNLQSRFQHLPSVATWLCAAPLKKAGMFSTVNLPSFGGDQTTKQAANVWIMVSLRRFPLIFGALFGLVSHNDPRHKPGKVVVGQNWGFLETKIKETYRKNFSLLLIGFQYDTWKVQVASLFPRSSSSKRRDHCWKDWLPRKWLLKQRVTLVYLIVYPQSVSNKGCCRWIHIIVYRHIYCGYCYLQKILKKELMTDN